jgi:hypothetical protein
VGVEALKTGAFTPPALVGPVPFTDLQAIIGKAETALEAFVPEEINGCAGKHLDLQIGPRRLAFTSETFILSFSLPNFHFHAVTHITSCAREACRSANVITRVGCAPVHSEPKLVSSKRTIATRTPRPPAFYEFTALVLKSTKCWD